MKKTIPIWLLWIFLCCCSENELQQALDFSQGNRKELEYVLNYYRNDPEKLKAAEYLIANMPHYYSYEDPRLDTLKRIQKSLRNNYRHADSIVASWEMVSYKNFRKVYDCRIISASFLIDNIERAFIQWKTKPWNRNLSFEAFCELLLPYRIGDEPLEYWRETYAARYAPILDSLYKGTDVVEAVACIGDYLRKEPFLFVPDLRLPHMGASFLLENRIGTCKDVCDFSIYLMRSLGIPTAVDAYRRRAIHSWTVLRDTTGSYVPFWLDNYQGSIIERGSSDGRLKGKVFRNCFAVQSVDSYGNSLFTKDVTADYFGPNRLNVPLSDRHTGESAYLAIYDKGWYPVAIVPVKRGKARVKDLEPGMIYIMLDRNMQEISYPFSISSNGEGRFFIPRSNPTTEAVLTRKVALWSGLRNHMNETAGSRIEGSNDIGFSEPEILAVLDSTCRFHNVLEPATHGGYRYLRFMADSLHRAQIAEIQIFDRQTDTAIPLRVLAQSPRDTLDRLAGEADRTVDGDVLTFYRSQECGGYILFDMGAPRTISRIFYIPRNDDNFIHPGDSYELFYQNGIEGWCSLGRQKADHTSLKYTVPQNAVFLLKNLTRGREEEIFFLDHGKQVFK